MPAYGNNYFPVGYQPIYPQQYQQMVQPQMQTQQIQQPQNQSSILWVRNGQEAAMYPVAPNNAVALWDSGNPVIYLKQADASGKPTMKTYDLVERAEMPQNDSKSSEGNSSDFATKTELAALASVVKDVDGLIASIREDVDALKAKTPKRAVRKDEDDGESVF